MPAPDPRSDRPRRRAAPGLTILLALLAVGCGGDAPLAPPVDVDEARRVLRASLDAWQAGQPPDAPARFEPPVRVADEDWLAGSTLTSYVVGTGDQLVGPTLRCPVTLRLRTKLGRTATRAATYNVATAPTRSVIRQD